MTNEQQVQTATDWLGQQAVGPYISYQYNILLVGMYSEFNTICVLSIEKQTQEMQ